MEIRSETIQAIRVGPDQGWATNMQIALRQIDAKRILYFQEDYFLTTPVDETQLAEDFQAAVEHDLTALCFQSLSLLEPEFAQHHARFAPVPAHSKGRTRLQVALWRREAFADTLRAGENAWEMEARGSERTRHLSLASYTGHTPSPISYLTSAIVRGLWTPQALALCREHRLAIQPHFRATLAAGKWRRRWSHATSRVRLTLALARQRSTPIDLNG